MIEDIEQWMCDCEVAIIKRKPISGLFYVEMNDGRAASGGSLAIVMRKLGQTEGDDE